MSAPARIPMPLRVPEIAPALGRLIVPRRLAPPWVPLDDIREKLATRVLDLAGEARRAAARDDRNEALDALDRASWLSAWEQAVGGAAERVADTLDQEIERGAHAVRMPRRRWRVKLLAGTERRAIAARFGTGGAGLVDALDQVAATSAVVRDASVLDHGSHIAWQDALQTAARRLEAAWLALEEAVTAERTRWAPELDAIARWRPPLWPVLVAWAVSAVVLIWFGLVLGGYLDAPAWLAQWLGF
jgi:hypothetical protein